MQFDEKYLLTLYSMKLAKNTTTTSKPKNAQGLTTLTEITRGTNANISENTYSIQRVYKIPSAIQKTKTFKKTKTYRTTY